MNYALDLVLLAAFLLFVLVGVHRGFIRSAVHFLGSIVAAFLASVMGGAVAGWVYDALFRQALVEKIGESISAFGGRDVAAAIQDFFSTLPDFLVRALAEAGVTVDALEGRIANQSGQAAELIADSLSPVFVGFLKVLTVIVLFFLFLMLVRILADLVHRVFQIPVLRQVDGLLGGVFGCLLALVTVWVAVSALQVFTPMLSAEAQLGVQEALDDSLLTGALVRLNPLGVMFR